MPPFKLSKTARLLAIIAISFSFFVAEIAVGFSTHSLALIADSFHYLGDLLSFVVALVALRVSEREDAPTPGNFSFGWQRAQLLGAFFNGVFLVALGLSIFLQSIERFVTIQKMERPTLVLAMGCVGLTLNLISALFIHEHHHHGGAHDHEKEAQAKRSDDTTSLENAGTAHLPHVNHKHHAVPLASPSHIDLGMLGVLLHVLSDAINNLGVIIAALVIHLTHSPSRFYADPAVSVFIALMILASSYPLLTSAGAILLQSAPPGVDLADVRHDLESIEGVVGVHELHAWTLCRGKAVGTAHVVLGKAVGMEGFVRVAETVGECLHAYGIESVTLQPEVERGGAEVGGRVEEGVNLDTCADGRCRVRCGKSCESFKCCA